MLDTLWSYHEGDFVPRYSFQIRSDSSQPPRRRTSIGICLSKFISIRNADFGKRRVSIRQRPVSQRYIRLHGIRAVLIGLVLCRVAALLYYRSY